MTLVVTHTKVSGAAAGSDPNRVYGTHWDANHALTGTVSNAQLDHMAQATIKGRQAGTGTGEAEDLTASQARTAIGVVIGTDVQAYDADLAALAANSTDGLWAHTGAGTGAARTITGPAAGVSVANGDGVSGNPTLSLANDLAALEGLASTGLAARTAADTWAQRTIAGTANEITLTNGDGVSGNPTASLPAALTFTGKTVTGGTFTSVSMSGTTSFDSGHIFNWNSSDVTVTHSANMLTVAGGDVTVPNLYIGSGGKVDFNSGDVTLTQSANALALAGGVLIISDTTDTSSTSTGAVQVAGGVGITKDLYVGGSITLNGPRLVAGVDGSNYWWMKTTGGSETANLVWGFTTDGASAVQTVFFGPGAGSGVVISLNDRTTVNSSNGLKVDANIQKTAPVTKTGDFTVALTENYIICNKGSSMTVTLPSAASFPGREIWFKTIQAQTVVSASSNVVPNTTATAGTAILPATDGAWCMIVSDGTNWIRMASSTIA